MLRFTVLGQLTAHADGADRAVVFGPTREGTVLAVLLARVNHIVSSTQLIDALWPDGPPNGVSETLPKHVYHLRRMLGASGAEERCIETRRPGYVLRVAPGALDAERFEERVRDGLGEPSAPHSAAVLADALTLWRGDAYRDYADVPELRAEATRLHGLRAAAIEARIDRDLRCGRAAAVIGELEALVAADALREGLTVLLMRALYATGRQADALRAYEQLRLLLAEEHGLTPGHEARAAQLAVLEQTMEVDVPTAGGRTVVASRGAPAAAGAPSATSGDGAAAEGSKASVAEGSAALPSWPDPIVGRVEEQTVVAGAFGSSRLVTVTGAGGVGKTRLAVEVARSLAGRFANGVRFIDFARAGSGAALTPYVAGGLGVLYPVDAVGAQWLHGAAAGLEVLVVMDNCEHVLDDAVEYARALVDASPRVHVLVTSREPLGVDGETVVRIDPLAPGSEARPGEAVELLVRRARRAGATVHDDDAALAQIARFVDGLPLALELLGPRLAQMKPAELSQILAEEGAMPSMTSPMTSPVASLTRNSLQAAFDSSFNRLSEPERRFLAAMSLCPAGLSLAAADELARVAGVIGPRGRSLLLSLVARSLVIADTKGSTSRYRMLQPIRECAYARLAADADPEAIRRGVAVYLAGFLARTAPGLRTSDEAVAASLIDADFDNVRDAVRWCLQAGETQLGLRLVVPLHDHLLARQRFEIGDWCEALVALDGAERFPEHAFVLGMAARASLETARLDRAARFCDAAFASEAEHGLAPSWHLRSVRVLLVAAGACAGDVRTELQALRASVADGGDPMGVAMALFQRVMVIAYGPNPEHAHNSAVEIERIGHATANPSMLAMGHFSVALATLGSDAHGAMEACREAFRIASSVGSTGIAAQAARLLIQHGAVGDDPRRALTSLSPVLRGFVDGGYLAQQLVTVMAMLLPMIEAGAAFDAAVLTAALRRSVWAHADQLTAPIARLEGALTTEESARAARIGGAMSAADLVRHALSCAERAAALVG